MKNNKDRDFRPVLFFLIGFIGFQILWYFVILPLI